MSLVPLALGTVQAGAQLYADSIVVKPKRGFSSAGSGPSSASFVSPQVTIRESHRDTAQITDHPVELGSTISDHAYMLPAELELECAWSDSPSQSSLLGQLASAYQSTISGAQSILSGNTQSQVQSFYNTLLDLQTSFQLLDLYTGKRLYKNMLIKTMATATDKEHENSLIVSVGFRQVLLVSTSIVAVTPIAANQADASITAAPVNNNTQSLTATNKFDSSGTGVPPAFTGGATGSW